MRLAAKNFQSLLLACMLNAGVHLDDLDSKWLFENAYRFDMLYLLRLKIDKGSEK